VWTPDTYSVTFTETGLPGGTTWSVSVNGVTESSTSSTIVFQEPNGSYTYTVKDVSGYTVAVWGGSFLVSGGTGAAAVAYSVLPSVLASGCATPSTVLGLAPAAAFGVLGAVFAAVLVALFLLYRPRRSRYATEEPDDGEAPTAPAPPSAPSGAVSFQGSLWIWPKGEPGWEEQGREEAWPVSVDNVRREPTILLTPNEPKDYVWFLADQYIRCLAVTSITNRADEDREIVLGAILKDLPPETGPHKYRLHVQLVRARSTWIPPRPLLFSALPGYRLAVGLSMPTAAPEPAPEAEEAPPAPRGRATRHVATPLPRAKRATPRRPPRPWNPS
ncbi:MAG TPA: hypothetical protein VLY85_02875, partial [Thermoplasmata archaeon]|nr:hypothetical protein [Thermoplasmata archaeon]